jgi:O-antigen/teichoic acid export membrane protein
MLVAAQAQLTLNGIMLSAALARHVGGVIVVLIWPTLLAYLTWHATIALLETLVRGKLAWKTLGVIRNQVKWKTKELRPAWKLIASMSGAILLGALTVQMDRIILSRMTSIDQFGYYTVAATVALGSLQLINPLTQAILPRAIQMRADPIALHSLNIKLARIIALIVGVGALIFITIGKWILDIWLRNPLVVTAVHPLLAILLIGTCLNAFYNVGYMNWIAQEKVHRIFQVNALALLLSVTLIPPLILWQGTIGAAFGWLIINLIGFVFSLGWIKWKTNKSMVKQ